MRRAGPYGTLQAHLARANTQWREFDPKVDALVIFQGPERYITPSWYDDEAGDGKGRADLELCDRAGLRPACG